MRRNVKCLNCGLLWTRVTTLYDGTTIELIEDIQYNCPKCGSNWYEVAKENKDVATR